jgi:hypothetical protein
MYQLLYTSKAVTPFKEDDIAKLLDIARLNNSKKLITGMLLYCNGNFIQLLEGNEQLVTELYEIIAKDPRHTEINKVFENQIERPQFPDWSMGYKFLSPQQLTNLEKGENIDVTNFIKKTQPFKLLKLMSAKSWN